LVAIKWLARWEDQACGPYSFGKAKAAAIAMAVGAFGDYQVADSIKHLNALSARYEHDANDKVEEKSNAPISVERHQTPAARAPRRETARTVGTTAHLSGVKL
jgi:hypothetical protein